LNFVAVQADSGAMGGSQSQEFMVYAEAGEDLIASCSGCNYAANMDKATSQLPPVENLPGEAPPELVHTPGRRTIEDVGTFLGLEPAHQIKTMAFMALTQAAKAGAAEIASPVVVFLRGDHTVNLAKLTGLFPGARELRPMTAEEILSIFHSPAGYLGPIGLDALAPGEQAEAGKTTVILDSALDGRRNLVAGANREEYHLRNVTPRRDFIPTLTADVRNVTEGESCPQCPGSALKVAKAIEVGHIFKLGYRYSDGMGIRVLDPNGKEVTPIMGCYGIGIERILTAAIEQNHDANGFWLGRSIAPFDVVVTVTNSSDVQLAATGEQVAIKLEEAGFEVLLDDRDERAGVKFKDADLIGIPFRINVGKKAAEGRLELVTRSSATSQDVPIGEIVKRVHELV
jgi:prolyl-tRNA synthetase